MAFLLTILNKLKIDDMKKGNINVSVENIFPLIKKFLYSDHEIFLRELISNATDATSKMKHLIAMGEAAGAWPQVCANLALVVVAARRRPVH